MTQDHELHEVLLPQPASSTTNPPSSISASISKSTSFLDGLRGFAAVLVFNQHFLGGYYPVDFGRGFGDNGNHLFLSLPFVRILHAGSAAVAVFFVISGYVVSRASFLKLGRSTFWKGLASSTVRRPFRLFLPPIIWSFIQAMLLHVPGLMEHGFFRMPEPDVWLELRKWFHANVFFFSPFRTHTHRLWHQYSIVLWSIPVEFKGSLIVYALVAMTALLSGVSPLLLLAAGSVLTILLLFNAWWVSACFIAGALMSWFDTRIPGIQVSRHIAWFLFVIGLYLLCEPTRDNQIAYSANAPGWGVLTAIIPARYHDFDDDEYYRFWHSVGGICVTFAVLHLPTLQRFFDSKSLRLLGRVSFMLYIFHVTTIFVFGDRLARALSLPVASQLGTMVLSELKHMTGLGIIDFHLRLLLFWALTLGASLVTAYFATLYIDDMCVALAKDLAALVNL
ncbi:hypothetical protein PYCC9005_005105 [Savitreella phatthalungensis]